jgi:methionine aminopeptidase
MRINTVSTVSQIEPFAESQTQTQQRLQSRRLVMDGVHMNRQAVHCPIKPSRIVEKAIAITGGCYE